MTYALLAFGEVLWDLFSSDGESFQREVGGAPANVCVHVARLGGRAAVYGAVGTDVFGTALRQRLWDEGVDVRGLAARKERTGIAFVLRTAGGQPRFLFYRQATADMAYGPVDLPPRLPRARFALVGTSTLVRPALAKATHRFVAQSRAVGAALILDLNVRAHLWSSRAAVRAGVASLAKGARLVKASSDDLAALDVGDEAQALAWVRRHAPTATLLVTRGADLASALSPSGLAVHVAPPKARCVDATGAGDGFLAGAVAVLASLPRDAVDGARADAALRAALTVGVRVGARVVTRPGAVARDTRDLRKLVERSVQKLAPSSRRPR